MGHEHPKSWHTPLQNRHKILLILGVALAFVALLILAAMPASGDVMRANQQNNNPEGSTSSYSAQIHGTNENENTEVTIESKKESDSGLSDTGQSGSVQSDTSVRVNGQNIPVPDNGTVHMSVPSNGNATSNNEVDVRIKSKQSSSTYESADGSVEINIESHSVSTSDDENKERRSRR